MLGAMLNFEVFSSTHSVYGSWYLGTEYLRLVPGNCMAHKVLLVDNLWCLVVFKFESAV
jgi:hypothetical protein